MPTPPSGARSKSPEPTTFILTGSINEIDAPGRSPAHRATGPRRDRPGESRVAPGGDQVVVRGVRDLATERAFLVEIVRTVPPKEPGARMAVDRLESFAAQKHILALVLSLLFELRQEVQIIECNLLLVDDHYAIRLEIPRVRLCWYRAGCWSGPSLDPGARRTVRDMRTRSSGACGVSASSATAERGAPPRASRCWPGPGALAARDRCSPTIWSWSEEDTRRHLACRPTG
jgi:hypothetical protein